LTLFAAGVLLVCALAEHGAVPERPSNLAVLKPHSGGSGAMSRRGLYTSDSAGATGSCSGLGGFGVMRVPASTAPRRICAKKAV
jgi:hypothetical protein